MSKMASTRDMDRWTAELGLHLIKESKRFKAAKMFQCYKDTVVEILEKEQRALSESDGDQSSLRDNQLSMNQFSEGKDALRLTDFLVRLIASCSTKDASQMLEDTLRKNLLLARRQSYHLGGGRRSEAADPAAADSHANHHDDRHLDPFCYFCTADIPADLSQAVTPSATQQQQQHQQQQPTRDEPQHQPREDMARDPPEQPHSVRQIQFFTQARQEDSPDDGQPLTPPTSPDFDHLSATDNQPPTYESTTPPMTPSARIAFLLNPAGATGVQNLTSDNSSQQQPTRRPQENREQVGPPASKRPRRNGRAQQQPATTTTTGATATTTTRSNASQQQPKSGSRPAPVNRWPEGGPPRLQLEPAAMERRSFAAAAGRRQSRQTANGTNQEEDDHDRSRGELVIAEEDSQVAAATSSSCNGGGRPGTPNDSMEDFFQVLNERPPSRQSTPLAEDKGAKKKPNQPPLMVGAAFAFGGFLMDGQKVEANASSDSKPVRMCASQQPAPAVQRQTMVKRKRTTKKRPSSAALKSASQADTSFANRRA